VELTLADGNDVRVAGVPIPGQRFSEEIRGYVPLPAIVGSDRDRLLVVAGQRPLQRTVCRGLEHNPIADPELQHLGMRPHLAKEPQARDDAMIEVDKLGLAQPVNVDLFIAVPVLAGVPRRIEIGKVRDESAASARRRAGILVLVRGAESWLATAAYPQGCPRRQRLGSK
jgi:hypothetical protein